MWYISFVTAKERKIFMIENKVSKKYVLLLFSFLVLLVVGNLIVNFNLIDLTYLCFMIVMGLRYIKIKYTT